MNRIQSTRLNQVPQVPAVYLLTDVYARVLYVGESINLRTRLQGHQHINHPRVSWVCYCPCEDHKDFEVKVIEKTNPLWNKKDNPTYLQIPIK